MAYMKTNVVLFTNYIAATLKNEANIMKLVEQNDQQNTVMFVVYDKNAYDMHRDYLAGHKYRWNQVNVATDTIQPQKSAIQLTKPSDPRIRSTFFLFVSIVTLPYIDV